MRTLSAAVAAVALVLSGCQQTNEQAITAARPAWAAVRASLPTLVKLLSDAPTEGRAEGLSWVEADSSRSNTVFLTLEQLRDPDVESDEARRLSSLDLYAGGDFLHCLQWTGAKNPMASSALGTRGGDSLRKDCEEGLAIKYVVVLDTIRSTLPQLSGEGLFAGGEAMVRVTVLDRLAPKALVTFTIDGQPGERVRYEVRPGEEKAAKLAAAVHSAMWVSAREQLYEQLRELGATITPR